MDQWKPFGRSYPNDLIVDYVIHEQGVEEGKVTLDFMGSDPVTFLYSDLRRNGEVNQEIFTTYVKDYHPFRCKIWEYG